MVVIRLARGGAKKQPFYHVVVADKRRAATGRYIEKVGFYNPVARGNAEALRINLERVNYWLAQGAQPSDRVTHLIDLQENPAKAEKIKQRKADRKTKAAVAKQQAAQAAAKAEAQAAEEAAAASETTEQTEAEKPAAETTDEKPADKEKE